MDCRGGVTEFIQTAPTRLLAGAARGQLDLNHLARVELASESYSTFTTNSGVPAVYIGITGTPNAFLASPIRLR